MRFLSQLQHGVYTECYADAHNDVPGEDDVQADIQADQDRHV